MARQAAEHKILNSNRSSYNLIAHDQYVPPSPPFAPDVRKHARIDPAVDYQSPRADGRGRNYANEREEQEKNTRNDTKYKESARWWEPAYHVTKDYNSSNTMALHENHIPASPLYKPGQGNGVVQIDPGYRSNQGDRRDDGIDRLKQNTSRYADNSVDNQNVKGHESLGVTIGNVNQVPVSPLYRPGLGKGLPLVDPRSESSQRRRELGVQEVPHPKQPPTPDYNTTHLHIPNDNNEVKLNLGGLRGSQEDLRDYKPNNASWAGYQDHAVLQGPPDTDRSGYRSYREGPWTSRDKAAGYISDPRVGGHHDGMGYAGSRNGGALLFIRFPVGQGENIHAAAQAFLKSKTHDTGGKFLGLAKKVFDFGYEKGPTEGIGVFHFPSAEKAALFFQMDPNIRQPDFPIPNGHAEIWIINNAYLPDNLNLFSTFLLSEIELHSGKDKREFFETFQKPYENYLYKNGAMPFVICSYGEHDRKSLRRHMYSPTAIVTCHLFQGLDHLNWITCDETYSKFRSLHNQMATEKCSIFNLSREMFP